MKRTRRHSNTKGNRQVRTGKTFDQVRRIARRLGIPLAVRAKTINQERP